MRNDQTLIKTDLKNIKNSLVIFLSVKYIYFKNVLINIHELLIVFNNRDSIFLFC